MTVQPLKIVVLGDSIADGLGVRGRSYADLLNAWCLQDGRAMTVQNMSATGQTGSDGLLRLPEVHACNPDWLILAFGNFDAVIRPVQRAMHWVPPRWRTKGWLDPRPYFSKRLLKGVYQRIESAIRWRYRVALLRAFGGEPATPPATFQFAIDEIVRRTLDETAAKLMLVTPAGIDDRLYPGTNMSMERMTCMLHSSLNQRIACKRLAICRTAPLLSRPSDFFADGFHPNQQGHSKIAKAIVQVLEECTSIARRAGE